MPGYAAFCGSGCVAQPLRISLIRSHKKGTARTHIGDMFLDPLKLGESTQKVSDPFVLICVE